MVNIERIGLEGSVMTAFIETCCLFTDDNYTMAVPHWYRKRNFALPQSLTAKV